MKEKIKIYIALVLIAVILIGGFFIWQNYQVTEKKYLACLEKCKLENPTLELTGVDSLTKFLAETENKICVISCKEKYGK